MDTKTTGFASPAQGYEDQTIDLNRLLVHNPPATYFLRLESSDMAVLGMARGSLLIVDRSKTPIPGQYALIRHEGQFFCRLMADHSGRVVFTNGATDLIPSPGETEIIGTVSASIQMYGNAH